VRPIPATDADREEVIALVVGEQARPERNVPAVGDDPDGLRAELAELDPPWPRAAVVQRDDGHRLVGAAHVEWDAEVDRAWVGGPWIAGDDAAWADHADPLVEAVLALVPDGIGSIELSGNVDHTAMAALARRRGLEPTVVNHVLVLDAATAATWAAPRLDAGIRPIRADDLAVIGPLHDTEFPGTHLPASRLAPPADPDGSGTADHRRTAVVLDEGEGPVGYAVGQVLPDGEGYVDYLGVVAAARGRGIGRRLVTALCRDLLERAPLGRVALTVEDPRAPARALYATLGFRIEASIVGYRGPRH